MTLTEQTDWGIQIVKYSSRCSEKCDDCACGGLYAESAPSSIDSVLRFGVSEALDCGDRDETDETYA